MLPNGGLELHPVTWADRKASRPKTLIIFHLTDEAVHSGRGVVRTDAGPISVDELRQFLTDTDADITVKPVLDPADIAPVDSYEIPPDMRTGVSLRNPDSVFPFGGSSSGRTDLDHTRPYLRGGPPGQTSVANLGPLTRTEHRAKTVGRWTVRQPEPGTYLWRSPAAGSHWSPTKAPSCSGTAPTRDNSGAMQDSSATWLHELPIVNQSTQSVVRTLLTGPSKVSSCPAGQPPDAYVRAVSLLGDKVRALREARG